MVSNAKTQTQYNKRGRPARRGAGKKKTLPGYVDSTLIDFDDEELVDTSSGDDEKSPKKRKRKRSPSPAPPPLNPIIYNEEPDEPSDSETGSLFKRTLPIDPVVLQFNIPLGYHGPMMVKLDRSHLSHPSNPSDLGAFGMQPPQKAQSPIPTPVPTGMAGRKGFVDLPAELRNKVYRALFVADDPLHFHNPHNFGRSAQFLRTCKTVYEEGCSVLYGENRFVFDRNRHQRGPFWEAQPKEIGYQDVRTFLKMIGPENLQYLRDVKITFEDAAPASTPYLPNHESRRYLNDGHLIDCLRLLRNAKLRKFTMEFSGRRTLCKTDVKFLSYLEQIKADEVANAERRWYNMKIQDSVYHELQGVMTRKKKLYLEQK